MTSEEKKLKILDTGADLIHLKGFESTGIKDIMETVGFPKGSFYYYFGSKEEFGLALINHISHRFPGMADQIFDASINPGLAGLEQLFIGFEQYFTAVECTRGCPIGNLAQEMGSINTDFAAALEDVFRKMSESVLKFLESAADRGEIPKEKACRDTADFIIHGWEGSLTRMKVNRNLTPLLKWREITFNHFLKSFCD